MTTLLDTLFNGLALGAVYALVALGFVIIFKASGVMNFAHGSLLLLGGYLTAVLHDDLGFAGALAVSVLATAAVAGVMDRFLLQAGGPDLHGAHVQTIVTIGVDILILTDLSRRIGGDLLSLGDPWGDSVSALGPVTVADSRIAAIVVSGVVIAGVFALFRYTSWGLSLRAAAEDVEAGRLDLAFAVRTQADSDQLRSVPLTSEPMTLLCHSSHRLPPP
ncbi:ABC transporter permease subunit, partial [Streptomyces sp. NRRL S-146]|uniref:ABC transporter permease subunit n=1 Tax=Streptomyces sp. NRRL S-146 TaxID=1463884 RepID=UPI003B63C177